MNQDFQTQVLTELGNIKATCASTAEKVEALAGPNGRVTALESSQKRQFWYTVAVMPIIAGFHAGLRKLGVDI